MKRVQKTQVAPLLLALLMVIALVLPGTPSVGIAANGYQTTVDLKTASTFAVLAGETITNTGTTVITGTAGGDIGVHPGSAIVDNGTLTYSGDAHPPGTGAAEAKIDLQAAYTDASTRTPFETIAGDIGGETFLPGVYYSGSTIEIDGVLTLDGGGDPNAVFIFQAVSELNFASGSVIELINGAQACRVFWAVGSSATLGTGSVFVGHIMAQTSIAANTGAEIYGQLLALEGEVTLQANTIINDVCSGPGSLVVTKEVQGTEDGMTLPVFTVTVTGPFDFTDTQVIEAGSSYTWEGLGAGSYVVSEAELSGEWSVSGTGQYEVQLGEVTEVTITNTYTAAEELPATGGNALLMTYSGLAVLGLGLLIRRKWK